MKRIAITLIIGVCLLSANPSDAGGIRAIGKAIAKCPISQAVAKGVVAVAKAIY